MHISFLKNRLFITLISIIFFILIIIYTTIGLKLVYFILKPLIPGKLSITNLSGTLNSGINFTELNFEDAFDHIIIKNLKSQWDIELSTGTIIIKKLITSEVNYLIKNYSSSNIFFPSFMSIYIDDIKIEKLSVKNSNIKLDLKDINSSLHFSNKMINVKNLEFFHQNVHLGSKFFYDWENNHLFKTNLTINFISNDKVQTTCLFKLTGDNQQFNGNLNCNQHLSLISHIHGVYSPKNKKLNLTYNWDLFNYKNHKTRFNLPPGSIDLTYNLANNVYQFGSTLKTNDPSPPIQILGKGDSTALFIDKFKLFLPTANFEFLSTYITWEPYLQYNGNFNIYFYEEDKLNLGLKGLFEGIYQKYPEQFSLNTKINGKNKYKDLKGDIRLVSLKDKTVFKKFDFVNKNDKLKIDGYIENNEYIKLLTNINIANLSEYNDKITGSIVLNSKILGNISEFPDTNINATINNLKISNLKIESAKIAYVLSKNRFKSNIDIVHLINDNLKVNEFALNIFGTRQLHHISLIGNINKYAINSNITAQFHNNYWGGNIKKFIISDPIHQTWTLKKPATYTYSSKDINLGNFCLTSTNQRLCIQTEYKDNRNFKIKANSYLNTDLLTYYLPSLSSNCYFDISINSHIEKSKFNLHSANIKATNCTIFSSNKESSHHFKEISFESILKNKEISNILLILDLKDQKINSSFTLQSDSLDFSDLNKTSILGKTFIKIDQINQFNPWTKNILKAFGRLSTNVTYKGTIIDPVFNGEISLQNGMIEFPIFGIKLNKAEFKGTFIKNEFSFKSNFSSVGNIQLYGNSRLNGFRIPDSAYFIKGTDFQIYNKDHMTLYINPDLEIKTKNGLLNIFGQIIIPKGDIFIKDYSSVLELPGEVKFSKDKRKVPSILKNYVYDFTIQVMPKVKLDAFGLKGTLTGNVKLLKNAIFTDAAFGNISIIDGKYKLFNQELKIVKGMLAYTGNPFNNPDIDLKATKRILQNDPNDFKSSQTATPEKVGIIATGKIQQPQISLFSEPVALPQSSILSYLALGRDVTAENAADNARQNLLSAVALLYGQKNDRNITESLQSSLALDEIGVQTEHVYTRPNDERSLRENNLTTKERTAIVIGKRISPRIYLTYNYDIESSNNILKAKISLINKLKLQLEQSQIHSAANLTYEYEFWD